MRAIGVSNFEVNHLLEIFNLNASIPSVNQVCSLYHIFSSLKFFLNRLNSILTGMKTSFLSFARNTILPLIDFLQAVHLIVQCDLVPLGILFQICGSIPMLLRSHRNTVKHLHKLYIDSIDSKTSLSILGLATPHTWWRIYRYSILSLMSKIGWLCPIWSTQQWVTCVVIQDSFCKTSFTFFWLISFFTI